MRLRSFGSRSCYALLFSYDGSRIAAAPVRSLAGSLPVFGSDRQRACRLSLSGSSSNADKVKPFERVKVHALPALSVACYAVTVLGGGALPCLHILRRLYLCKKGGLFHPLQSLLNPLFCSINLARFVRLSGCPLLHPMPPGINSAKRLPGFVRSPTPPPCFLIGLLSKVSFISPPVELWGRFRL